MNHNDTQNDSLIEINKVIKIINDELSIFSTSSIMKELNNINQNDPKSLRIYLLSYIKSIEKAKENIISKCKSRKESKEINTKELKINNYQSPHNINLHKNPKIKNIKMNLSRNQVSNINNNNSSFMGKEFKTNKINSPNSSKNNIFKLNKSANINNTDLYSPKSISSNIKLCNNHMNSDLYNYNSNNNTLNPKLLAHNNKKSSSTSKPHMTNNENNIAHFLAGEIVKFIDGMRTLQISICKKDPNVNQLKKNFELQKKQLYIEASKLLISNKGQGNASNNPSSMMSSTSTILTKSTFANQAKQKNESNNNNNVNNNNNSQQKEIIILNESISTLKQALEDIKSNSVFLTNQLRIEINNLNIKINEQKELIATYEKRINKDLLGIKEIYKTIKGMTPVNLDTSSNSVSGLTINTISNNNTLSVQNDNKFESYESEIKKYLALINNYISNNLNNNLNNNLINNYSFADSNHNTNNNDKKISINKKSNRSASNLNNDNQKIIEIIRKSGNEIIKMIHPFICENDEIELDMFESGKDDDLLEESILINIIQNLKVNISKLIEILNKYKNENEFLENKNKELSNKNDAYKQAIENTVTRITRNSSNSNSNNQIKNANSNLQNNNIKIKNNPLSNKNRKNKNQIFINEDEIQDLYSDSNNNELNHDLNNDEINRIKKINSDLLSIQNELLKKLEIKDIDNDKNIENIKTLLKINNSLNLYNNTPKSNGKYNKMSPISPSSNNTNEQMIFNDNDLVSGEKYRYLLNLYSNDLDELKQWKNDYLHLIQEFSCYIATGAKIKVDPNNIYKAINSTEARNYNEFDTNECESGRINENDLLTKSSRNDNLNLNNINKDNSNNKGNKDKNNFIKIEDNGKDYFESCENDYYANNSNNKESENIKKLKSEINKLNSKLNDVNNMIMTISNAVVKLFGVVNDYNNPQVKEYFTLIFRIINYSEDKIRGLFAEKEIKK